MKIVFYNETLLSGGIEKCIESFVSNFSKKYDIEIVYIDEKKLDNKIVDVLNKNATVHKLENDEIIEADICIWCRIYMNYSKLKQQIKAKKNYLWVHSKPRERQNCILDNQEFLNEVDEIICVSDVVQEMLNINKKSIVIHNFLPDNIKKLANYEIEEDVLKKEGTLKLVTVSRLSEGKGFDRVENLVKQLKEKNVDFEYVIIGKGRNKEAEIKNSLSKYKEVKFLGYKENPFPYIKKADYLVQLSDFETWGNVISEAKTLETPVIVTSFKTAYEQIEDDVNGVIIQLEDSDYSKYIDKIVNNKQKYKHNLKDFVYKNEIQEWEKLFE